MNPSISDRAGDLSHYLDAEIRTPVSPAAMALSDRLKARYGEAVLGIVYYGSCFRTGTEKDGILDIFVIVDDYQNVYPKRTLAVANRLLPPNVFYDEMAYADTVLRTKYAVISLDQFLQRTSPRCFHTFFWARFAQPCALTFARDDDTRRRIVTALGGAIDTFISRVLPLLPSRFDTQTLWTHGLSASYRTELRPEPPGSSTRLVEKNLIRYRAVTQMTLAGHSEIEDLTDDSGEDQFIAAISEPRRWWCRQTWRVRRVQGKIINLLRIMKAAFTFDGGVDYVLWKIERHSGVKVEATPMLRRHPLLACWPTVWRLYRAGAFR